MKAKLFVLAVLIAGCATGSSTAKKDSSTASGTDSTASSEHARGSSVAAKKVVHLHFDEASPRNVTALRFVADRLAVGYSDGGLATIDPGQKTASRSRAPNVYAVSAIAPAGDMVLLSASPPVIANLKGKLILRMNTVKQFNSAAFAPDGLTLYVADKTGKVRIWGQPHSFEKKTKEGLDVYLNRQGSDFTVQFPPIRGPIHVDPQGNLVVVDKNGVVHLWDPTHPSGSKHLMKLDAVVRSLDATGGHVFATSITGKLKVGKMDGTGYFGWSRDAHGGYVVGDPSSSEDFYELDTKKLWSRDVHSGESRWSVEVPDGHPCGLAISPDGNTLAACIDNFVALFDAEDGTPHSYVYRNGSKLVWKTAEGEKLH